MGMDFTAMLCCDPRSEAVSRALDTLEATDRPQPLQAVVKSWKEYGFFGFYEDWRVPVWVQYKNHEAELATRPTLPSLQVNLRLPEGFFVTVAKDAIIVYHLLRWRLFLTEPKWQSVMFDALRWFCDEFAAEDCVLAHDCQWVPRGIRQGLSFAEALRQAEREGGGQVSSFKELYIEKEDESDVAMKPAKGNLAECAKWPRNKPLPAGWTRPMVWDSKGYWRLDRLNRVQQRTNG